MRKITKKIIFDKENLRKDIDNLGEEINTLNRLIANKSYDLYGKIEVQSLAV